MDSTLQQAVDSQESERQGIPFGEALGVWVRVAIYSFGGPAGQIAVMHRYVVEEKKWVSEPRFLHALNYTMLLPGPEAQQLATYLGGPRRSSWAGWSLLNTRAHFGQRPGLVAALPAVAGLVQALNQPGCARFGINGRLLSCFCRLVG